MLALLELLASCLVAGEEPVPEEADAPPPEALGLFSCRRPSACEMKGRRLGLNQTT